MLDSIEFEPEWKLTVYQSPLDEKPWVYLFDFFRELEDKIQQLESESISFDINLCEIERI